MADANEKRFSREADPLHYVELWSSCDESEEDALEWAEVQATMGF